MEGEMKNLIKVWIVAMASLCYCYYAVARIRGGMLRLLYLLPIFYLFTILPLTLHTVHFGGTTTFFLVWLGNFKLLLFAFDQGPLSPLPPNLFHFISIACLPIKIKQDPILNKDYKPLNTRNGKNPSYQKAKNSKQSSPNLEASSNPLTTKVPRSILFLIKALLLAMIIRAYDHRPNLHPSVIFALYCGHLYLALEIALALAVTPARAIFGFELEPQFNEPYLATSLQDFWGRRWNLMVTSILRPTVYNPTRRVSVCVVGPRWASLPAVFATFLVSGLIHEVIYYYITRANPTWEVTWFFVLHGLCVVIEIVVKKAVKDRWKLHRAISGPLTIGFVAVTGAWLFFPQILSSHLDDKIIHESSILIAFISWPLYKFSNLLF
ncbi:hypothetical protein I3843_12G133700 [Carya illinoinensis]|nr:hypothetical protein I3843_12G133700 [Carya illinoinensis]